MISDVIAKEKEVSSLVKKLQADLATERQLHVQEVEERKQIIDKLKEDLQDVRTNSAVKTKCAFGVFVLNQPETEECLLKS